MICLSTATVSTFDRSCDWSRVEVNWSGYALYVVELLRLFEETRVRPPDAIHWAIRTLLIKIVWQLQYSR